MNRWIGRCALVTGASTGIGAAICRELVKHGMTVLGCGRNVDKIASLATDLMQEDVEGESIGQLLAWKCDMTVEAEIITMHEEIRKNLKRLDVCINNAMSTKNSSLITGETEDWRYMIELGITGACINTREAIKLMRENNINDGQIIQLGSIVGHKIPSFQKPPENVPNPWFHIYNGTKWMNRALAEGLRQEVKAMDSRIRVATISPGAVETELFARGSSKEAAAAFFNSYKVLQPKDVADAVVYILSTPEHVNVHDIIMEPLSFQV